MNLKSEFIKVVEVDKKLPTVIAFSSVNTPKGKFKPFKIVNDSKLNVIFLNDNGNRWYLNGIDGISDDPRIAAEKIIDHARKIGNGRVITFGTSMGAYGAVLYSLLGNADGCLAFGVESEIGIPGSRSEMYCISKDNIYYSNLTKRIKSATFPIYLFASESDEVDLLSASSLSGRKVENYLIKGIEHPGIQLYDIDNKAGDIINEFALNLKIQIRSHRIYNLKRLKQQDSVIDLYNAMLIKKSGDFKSWLEFLLKLNERYKANPIFLSKLGEAFQKNNQTEKANKAWLESTKLCGFQSEAFTKLGANLRRAKSYRNAKLYLQKSIEINPFSAHSHHTLAQLCVDMNTLTRAEEHFREACRLNGGNSSFKKSLIDFLELDLSKKSEELKKLKG